MGALRSRGRFRSRPKRRLDPRIEFGSVRHAPDPDRVDYVARLAAAWARLACKARPERRLALVLSDYPARGGRTGYAVGLDTSASAAEILRLLRGEGYDTGALERSTTDIERFLLDQSERVKIPLTVSIGHGSRLCRKACVLRSTRPGAMPIRIPPLWADAFELAVLCCGHVLMVLQPDRGLADDRKAGYHDMSCPPRHAYRRDVCVVARSGEDRRPHPSRHPTARSNGYLARRWRSRPNAGPRLCWDRSR
jgi:cobaltochelatase CobN